MARFRGFHWQTAITPYVILFIERDGSTYLTSLLAAHPDVQAVYERFAVLKQQGQTAEQQLDWARGFLSPPLIGRYAAVGFKTKLVDVLDPAGFAALLREKRCRVIQMQRRNQVKAVISRINARRLHDRSGNWNLYHEADRQPAAEVDLAQFAEFLREREQADAELEDYCARLGLPTLKLVYEDLLMDRAGSIGRVFEFLRVRWLPVEGKTLKNTSDDLREAVLNFDELRAAYAGSAYEPMFDEGLAPKPA